MNEDQQCPLVKATGIDGCNIIVFGGKEFAREVANQVKELSKINLELAREYLKSMGSITITMSECSASFDNSTKED